MEMLIEEGNIVTIAYELRDNDAQGELLERMDSRYPFIFYFGNGRLLPEFEKQLHGLSVDSIFDFTLTPEEAYGRRNPLNIVTIPKDDFLRSSDIAPKYVEVGSMVNMVDDQGMQHTGKIVDVKEDEVKVDFNHIMVDKTLHFRGVVLFIRKATTEELVKGHYLTSEDINYR